MNRNFLKYADDDVTPIWRLILIRMPSLILGLFLGFGLSFVTSEFREVIETNIEMAFFIPFVVYMADAVGGQTQNIYIRDLLTGKASFKRYMIKESALGLLMCLFFGLVTAVVVTVWLGNPRVTMAVSLGIFGAVASAPMISMIVTETLELEHSDPAIGTGPIATVLQDTASVIIYGLIASAVFL